MSAARRSESDSLGGGAKSPVSGALGERKLELAPRSPALTEGGVAGNVTPQSLVQDGALRRLSHRSDSQSPSQQQTPRRQSQRKVTGASGISSPSSPGTEATTIMQPFPKIPTQNETQAKKKELDAKFTAAASGSRSMAGSRVLVGSRRSWTGEEDLEKKSRYQLKKLVCYRWCQRRVYVPARRYLMDHFLPVRLTRSRHRRVSQLGTLSGSMNRQVSQRMSQDSIVTQRREETTNLGMLSGQSYFQALFLINVLSLQSVAIGLGARLFEVLILALDHFRAEFCRWGSGSGNFANAVSRASLLPWSDLGLDVFPLPYLIWMGVACGAMLLLSKHRPWPDDLQNGPYNIARESLGTGKEIPMMACGLPKACYSVLYCGLLGGCLGYHESFMLFATALAGKMHKRYFIKDYSWLKVEYPILASCAMAAAMSAAFRNPLVGAVYGMECFGEFFVIGLGTICFLWCSSVACFAGFVLEIVIKDGILGGEAWHEVCFSGHIYKSLKSGLMLKKELDVDLNDAEPGFFVFLLFLPILCALVCIGGQIMVLKFRERVSELSMESHHQACLALFAVWCLGLLVVAGCGLILADSDFDLSSTDESATSGSYFRLVQTGLYEFVAGSSGRTVISSNEVVATWNCGWRLMQEIFTNSWFLHDVSIGVLCLVLFGRLVSVGISMVFLEELGGVLLPSLVVGSTFAVTTCRIFMAVVCLFRQDNTSTTGEVGAQVAVHSVADVVDWRASGSRTSSDAHTVARESSATASILDSRRDGVSYATAREWLLSHGKVTLNSSASEFNSSAGDSVGDGFVAIRGGAIGAFVQDGLDPSVSLKYPIRILFSRGASGHNTLPEQATNGTRSQSQTVSPAQMCGPYACHQLNADEDFDRFVDLKDSSSYLIANGSWAQTAPASVQSKFEARVADLKVNELGSSSLTFQRTPEDKGGGQIRLRSDKLFDRDVVYLQFVSLVGMVCFLTGTSRLPLFSILVTLLNYKHLALDSGVLRNVGHFSETATVVGEAGQGLNSTALSRLRLSFDVETVLSTHSKESAKVATGVSAGRESIILTRGTTAGSVGVQTVSDSSTASPNELINAAPKSPVATASVRGSPRNSSDTRNNVKVEIDLEASLAARAPDSMLREVVNSRVVAEYDPNVDKRQSTKLLFNSKLGRGDGARHMTNAETGQRIESISSTTEEVDGFIAHFLRDEWRYCFLGYAVAMTFMLCYMSDEESITERIAEQEGTDMLMLQFHTLTRAARHPSFLSDKPASDSIQCSQDVADLFAKDRGSDPKDSGSRVPSGQLSVERSQGHLSRGNLSRGNLSRGNLSRPDFSAGPANPMWGLGQLNAARRRHTHTPMTTHEREEWLDEVEEYPGRGPLVFEGGAVAVRQTSKTSNKSTHSSQSRLHNALFGPRRHTIGGLDMLGVIQEDKDAEEKANISAPFKDLKKLHGGLPGGALPGGLPRTPGPPALVAKTLSGGERSQRTLENTQPSVASAKSDSDGITDAEKQSGKHSAKYSGSAAREQLTRALPSLTSFTRESDKRHDSKNESESPLAVQELKTRMSEVVAPLQGLQGPVGSLQPPPSPIASVEDASPRSSLAWSPLSPRHIGAKDELEADILQFIHTNNTGVVVASGEVQQFQIKIEGLEKRIQDLKFSQIKQLAKSMNNLPDWKNVVYARNKKQVQRLVASYIEDKKHTHMISMADKITQVLMDESGRNASVEDDEDEGMIAVHQNVLEFLKSKKMKEVVDADDGNMFSFHGGGVSPMMGAGKSRLSGTSNPAGPSE